MISDCAKLVASYCTVSDSTKGGGSIYWVVRQRENGAVARREIFDLMTSSQ